MDGAGQRGWLRGWWGGGGRGSDDDTKSEEARPVQLAVRSRDGGTRADNYRTYGGQGEKILMSGRMRIAKIVKINFIIASTISFDPFQKLLPIPITTSILPLSQKTRRYRSIRRRLICRRPPH